MSGLQNLFQPVPEGFEVDRFLEVRRRSNLLAIQFGAGAGFPAHDDHRNQLRGAHGFKRPAKLEAGVIGHPQIEENRVPLKSL
jgi:hypothetical protein